MKAPDLESSKHIDQFFLIYIIKSNSAFQNIGKCQIHGLRLFKYNNIFGFCKGTPDKVKRGGNLAKTFLSL